MPVGALVGVTVGVRVGTDCGAARLPGGHGWATPRDVGAGLLGPKWGPEVRGAIAEPIKDTKTIKSFLSADTHNAPKNIISGELSLKAFLCHRANQKRNWKHSTVIANADNPSKDKLLDEFTNKS